MGKTHPAGVSARTKRGMLAGELKEYVCGPAALFATGGFGLFCEPREIQELLLGVKFYSTSMKGKKIGKLPHKSGTSKMWAPLKASLSD